MFMSYYINFSHVNQLQINLHIVQTTGHSSLDYCHNTTNGFYIKGVTRSAQKSHLDHPFKDHII